jgi:hypothetical protein
VEAPRREIVLPRAAYLGAALVFGGDVVYWRRDILPPIFLAFSLAYILDPVVDWLEAWHVLRPAGIALVLGRALGTIGLFLVLVLPGIATDIAGVSRSSPSSCQFLAPCRRTVTGTYSALKCTPALRRHGCFAPVREHVQIRQKTVRYRPIDKLLDALGGILWGAKTLAQNNVTIRTDRAVQRAFGRTGCAEQSTIARTLRAYTAENVAQLEQVSWYYLRCYGATPRHRFHDKRLWVDIDLTPMPIGAKAEGSEQTWMGRNRSKTGRKTSESRRASIGRSSTRRCSGGKRPPCRP